jgi:hypothetical protein
LEGGAKKRTRVLGAVSERDPEGIGVDVADECEFSLWMIGELADCFASCFRSGHAETWYRGERNECAGTSSAAKRFASRNSVIRVAHACGEADFFHTICLLRQASFYWESTKISFLILYAKMEQSLAQEGLGKATGGAQAERALSAVTKRTKDILKPNRLTHDSTCAGRHADN